VTTFFIRRPIKKEKHDYKIYKNNYPEIPKQVVTVADLGYLGMEKTIQIIYITLTKKKEKKPRRRII